MKGDTMNEYQIYADGKPTDNFYKAYSKEEAINKVKGYLTDYFSMEDCDELEEIIKALKQESVLDKIRTDIENLEEGITSYHNDRPWIYKDEALQIIDKYRTEMEMKEGRE